ncbi:exosome complex exonuclease Rrp41 [Candidatus Woesearchaeota archaeon]|nr:exosome complex exonuclease Rrp41 [Candidatus Woesearchaeota archaeon]
MVTATNAYNKRMDGRNFDELREIEAKVGVVKSADGSAMFKIGDTIAIAAVRGPRDLYPRFMQNPKGGILRCSYNMMSFSVDERIRPGPSRRSREITLVTENALMPAVDLSEFPNSVVDVFIEIVQADAGTRCAGICAASLALADAGIPMRDLVCAVSVGKVGGKILVDLNKYEEDYEDGSSDMPVAFLPRRNEISLLQLDGGMKKEEILNALELAKKSCVEILEVQRNALMGKYKNG